MFVSRKMRDLAVVFFVGLFFMTREMVFIWLLVGAMVILHPGNYEGGKKLKRRIVSDARKNGLKVPSQRQIREKLNRIYRKYENSVRSYPHLQSHYDEILDSLWLSLAADDEPETWNYLLKTVLAEWPEERIDAKKNLKNKLNEVGKLTSQWDEAHQEAFGRN